MESLKNRILCGAMGASTGISGFLSLSGCSGSSCASCFGCLGVGAGILLIVLIQKSTAGKEKHDGMA